jgi:hypothetical protein
MYKCFIASARLLCLLPLHTEISNINQHADLTLLFEQVDHFHSLSEF